MGSDGTNSASSPVGNYNYAEGTSYSTPITAGVAALMLSVNPALTPEEIRTILIETATKNGGAYDSDGFSLQKAYGQIDAGRAVEKAYSLR
jgi:subtilisin family serine protease